MTTNKTIAEKINVFLNLLFHLEDYITNKQQREEQLHVSEIIKTVLNEVSSSEIIKNFFYKGADINNEIIEDNKLEKEFRINKLTEGKIKYLKKVNPQSFNQKNLETLNFFYNSTGEADMIYDMTKMKVFSIIKFCLTQLMQKKLKQKEKEIYSKINFALVNKNTYYKKKNNYNKNDKNSLIYLKNRSISNLREKYVARPNFVISPPLLEPNYKIKNFPKIQKTNNNAVNAYSQTGFSKNYKLVQTNMDIADEEKSSKALMPYNNFKKKKIPSSSQLDLINILHDMKKRPIFSGKDTKNKKNMKKNDVIKIEENFVNTSNNDGINEIKFGNNKHISKKLYLKKENKKQKIFNSSREFDYNKVFNMFDALKKRGYLY